MQVAEMESSGWDLFQTERGEEGSLGGKMCRVGWMRKQQVCDGRGKAHSEW